MPSTVINGHSPNLSVGVQTQIKGSSAARSTPDIDASKLTVQLSNTLKDIPSPDHFIFGNVMTDHMLVCTHSPESGWSAPVIKPYGPLELDPASSVFHYAPAVFEGMKAFRAPDGTIRLFRPDMNLERMARSADRVALPSFNQAEVLKLITKLVHVEERWIPDLKGYSLYIRPTLIGTRPTLGVSASAHATLFIIVSPTGPYFPTGFKPISLYATYENVRAWPGGTGAFKLALNYAGCFKPQQEVLEKGYQQILWLLGDERKITEVGQMNFFVVLKREDGDYDLVTPPLDGTILPGVTRDSLLSLASHIPTAIIHPVERNLTISELLEYHASSTLLEAFGASTAAIIAPVDKIGYEGKDYVLPAYEDGLGPVGKALREKIIEIQEGRVEWKGWSVVCK